MACSSSAQLGWPGPCDAVDALPAAVDVVVNNASAINLSGTEELEVNRYDLMQEINVRGTFVVTKACLPHLKKSANNPHVQTLSPPLNLDP